jgi:hypothetical protein
MKVYGFRIGACGIEFATREDREKALLAFTKGGCVAIQDFQGPKYTDSAAMFATYERMTEQPLNNCGQCRHTFAADACTDRTFPDKDYNGKFTEKDTHGYICDGCYAARIKDAEVAKARATLATVEAA